MLIFNIKLISIPSAGVGWVGCALAFFSSFASLAFKPAIILVNHWTGSMGEGITMGFDALGKTKTVGTKMAGLSGAINGFQTSKTKIPYSFPTEQLYHVSGTPRENFNPTNLIDLTNSKYKEVDYPILNEGLNIINGDKSNKRATYR